MAPLPHAPANGRADAPPSVPNNVLRTGVLAALEHRWEHAVTTVVAGAGFGKSIAIGQAMRANQLRPRGVEVRVSCRSGCEDPDRLVTSVRRAFGSETGVHGAPLAQLQAVIADQAPLPTSLVLDDLELLAAPCVDVLEQLVRSAPTNLHLALVGRRLPPLPLARLRAADQLLEIGAAQLRFDDAEIEALAASLGVAPPADRLDGWPAVVRLSLAAPERAAGDFLWEEVIEALDPTDRQVLQALCALGESTPTEVEAMIGSRFDVDAFCAQVPLVHRVGPRLVAHDLWRPFIGDLGPAGSLETIAQRALDVVVARGDVVATGELAIRLGDRDALRRASVALVRDTLGSLPADIAEAWLAAADGGLDPPPETELLACALAHTRRAADLAPARLDAVVEAFDARGELESEAVAIALGAIAANATRDLGRLLELSVRARAVAEVQPDPTLELLVDGVGAALAMLQGDIGAALALLDRPRPGLPAEARSEALARLHWHLLLLAGRAADAASVVVPLKPSTAPAAERPLEAVARWLAGDSSALDPGSVDIGAGRYEPLSERDRFDQAGFVGVMAAALGDPRPVDHAVGVLTSSAFATETGPDAALVAVARACQRIVHHDERGAVREIDRFLQRGPVDDLTDAHLRRSLAVPYVCTEHLRHKWDQVELGPSQQLARSIARALVDARAGRFSKLGPEPLGAVCTVLPLPWAIELAARATSAGRTWGTELALVLADRFGETVIAEIARQAAAGEEPARHGAALLRRRLPTAPPATLEICVLGPLQIRRNGEPITAPQLSRARVRELLSVLVAERSVSRDRAIDVLWPDHDVATGRANLRVTLAHLQRLLEPDRGPRQPPYFVRANAARLSLAPGPGLEVDLWEAEHRMAEAEAARHRGDARERIVNLRRAVDLWQGRPLQDLERLPDMEPVSVHHARRLLDATLTLGELELVGGMVDRAVRCAQRALAADVYDERAHRLAIAASLQAGDRSGLSRALARLHDALDELGVGPDETTQMLVRQAAVSW